MPNTVTNDGVGAILNREACAVESEEVFVLNMGGHSGRGAAVDRAVEFVVVATIRMAVVDDVMQLSPDHVDFTLEARHL